jgi:phosphatidate cytidylyltransferase
MAKRTITALLLLAIAMPAVLFGGICFFLLIGFFIVTASWEYTQMFRAVHMHPSAILIVGGTAALLIVRAFFPAYAEMTLTLLVLLALGGSLLAYERGRDQAALDFTITVGGFLYLGWIGAYLNDLRALPDGGWWLMLVLPSVWMADTGAYALGVRYGKHKLAPRLSPKKSWEGYFAGVFTGTLGGGFFAWAYNVNTVLFGQPLLGPLTVSVWQGALLGFILAVITTLGDLGESLFKRQGGIKDSGNIIPGHGGAFDRIDSWLWGAVIGVFVIRWFFL